jgi:protein-tyrosine phosphatase
MIPGVDDGARNVKMMEQMIDASYESGVRVICMTPHHNPEYFECPMEAILEGYTAAVSYAESKYPDMRVFLGQEIYCHHDSVNELLSGECLSLNNTRNVLLEFGPFDDKSAIYSGVTRFLTSGFIPVIAHVERYSAMRSAKKEIAELRGMGARVQVNAASVIGKRGFFVKRFVMSLIKKGLVDVVADDSHDLDLKRPCLGEAFKVISDKFGSEVAECLFCKNPIRVLSN